MKYNTKNILAFLFTAILISMGCKKLVDVAPPDNTLAQENVYNNDNTAASVLAGAYARMSVVRGEAFHLTTLSKWAGLSADEFNAWSGAGQKEILYNTNALLAGSALDAAVGGDFWLPGFSIIYTCNSAIEGISSSKELSSVFRNQLLGEAKFLRAFVYFYLVNLYGDLPLVITTNPQINKSLAKVDKSEIYKLIVDDLKDARELLSSEFLNKQMVPYTGISERIRPSKWAASAMLARAYLYLKDYVNAESEASKVIGNALLFSLPATTDVFLKTSKEAIWQLQPVTTGWNTEDARMFNLGAAPAGFNAGAANKTVYISSFLLSAFEAGDKRRTDWVGSYVSGITYYFPNKYRQATQDASIISPAQMTEYRTILRLAEQYLIRAEARAMQGKIAESVGDLNIIRARARSSATSTVPSPLPDISTSVTQAQLFSLILHERQIELFSEWGHRWLDLKRTGKVDEVMNIVTPQKGGTWKTTQQLYPIPYTEILSDANLIQNSGY